MTQFGKSTAAPFRSRRRLEVSDRWATSERPFLRGVDVPRPSPFFPFECPFDFGFELWYCPDAFLLGLRLLSFVISGTSASAAKPTGSGTHQRWHLLIPWWRCFARRGAAMVDGAPASAFPSTRDAWKDFYGPIPPSMDINDNGANCQLCHQSTGSPWNGYGWDIRQALANPDCDLNRPRDGVDNVEAFIDGSGNLAADLKRFLSV